MNLNFGLNIVITPSFNLFMLFIIVFQYDYRYCINQTTNVRFCGFDSLHPKGNQSRLQIIENPTFYSLRIELRFRTTARDIPPFLPQRLGLEWTFLDLSGLEPQASNAVFSTNLSNIKDSGIYLRSPIYGAGEGNRTLDVSLGSSSFAIKLHPRGVWSFRCPAHRRSSESITQLRFKF